MVKAKTELFDPDLINAANLFKALGHPARLKILQFLSETKNCITGDISEELPLGRTTVNQHLKELKELDLIKGHIEGVKTKYCLNPEKIKELRTILGEFISNIESNNLKCE
jgi:DNA-binding transcriptional ArsR family regulator